MDTATGGGDDAEADETPHDRLENAEAIASTTVVVNPPNFSFGRPTPLFSGGEGNIYPPTIATRSIADDVAARGALVTGLEAAKALGTISAEREALVKKLSSIDGQYSRQLSTCNDIARNGAATVSRAKRVRSARRVSRCFLDILYEVYIRYPIPYTLYPKLKPKILKPKPYS